MIMVTRNHWCSFPEGFAEDLNKDIAVTRLPRQAVTKKAFASQL
jgi:hypothetical protein